MGEPIPKWMQRYLELAGEADDLFRNFKKSQADKERLELILKEMDKLVTDNGMVEH